MKLIFFVVVGVVALVVAPFIILWNAGKYGPAFAFVLSGIVIGADGNYLLPDLETWPSSKSQLTLVRAR